jgi:hypothetical protein
MIVLAMIATGWLALMVLIVGACRAASLGDQAQQQPSSPLTPQPDPRTAWRRRHTATLPGELRSPRDLPTR